MSPFRESVKRIAQSMQTCEEWVELVRDLREPIIGFSQDGSLAWAVVQVRVRGTRTRQDGMTREIEFVCAWLTLYERSDGEWKILAEASTFR